MASKPLKVEQECNKWIKGKWEKGFQLAKQKQCRKRSQPSLAGTTIGHVTAVNVRKGKWRALQVRLSWGWLEPKAVHTDASKNQAGDPNEWRLGQTGQQGPPYSKKPLCCSILVPTKLGMEACRPHRQAFQFPRVTRNRGFYVKSPDA